MSEEAKETSPLLPVSELPSSYASSGGGSSGVGGSNSVDLENSEASIGDVDGLSATSRAENKVGRTIFAHSTNQLEGSTFINVAKKKKKKRKKKKTVIHLNYDSAMELEYQVQLNLIKHTLASKFFESRQFWFFTITQGVLTMIASILAFVASSALIGEKVKDILATIVGSTSGIVVFLQTTAGVCNYGTRAAMHASAGIDLRDLRDEIVLIKFKVKKEEEQGIDNTRAEDESTHPSRVPNAMANHDDDSSDSDDSHDEEEQKNEREQDNVFGRIQQRYRQSLSGCKSNVPMPISEAFHGMHSNLLVSESLDNSMYMREVYGPHQNYKNIIHFKAFDILASEILNRPGFPLFLPNSQQVVDDAMKLLNAELCKYHQYWDDKLDEARRDAMEEALEDQQNPNIPKHLRMSNVRRFAESQHQNNSRTRYL